jgi:SPP1 family predicted phage head-tail adaptor
MGVGQFRHLGLFQKPGAAVPDGEGGYTEGWTDLEPPQWAVDIAPASVRDLERLSSSTVAATATHVITGRYRPDVDVSTRMLFEGRVFQVTGVINEFERDRLMRLVAEEQV